MMKLHPSIRSSIWTAVCVAVTLSAPLSSAAPAARQQAQAQLLDHAEFPCVNCFFGSSRYYYCFAAGNQILTGYQSTPVMNYDDPSKNYLRLVHRGWAAWKAPGQTVPISYDAKHIWVAGAEGKQVRLTRTSLRDIFTNNSQCRAAGSTPGH
jgi:hypothetical protein